MAQGRFFRGGTTYKIPEDLRILQFENARECVAIFRRRLRVVTLEIARQQDIELPHATPAAPPQSGLGTQCCRSAISFLISAIARAGFRSFGQASAQFMIVWQR